MTLKLKDLLIFRLSSDWQTYPQSSNFFSDDTISGTFDLSNNDPALSYETLACLLIIDTPDQRADAIDKLKIIKSN